MSEMSDFSNKNVHFFAPYLHIFALISRVDFSQPKYVGRLKSTLLTVIISAPIFISVVIIVIISSVIIAVIIIIVIIVIIISVLVIIIISSIIAAKNSVQNITRI